MAVTPQTYTGKYVNLQIGNKTHTGLGIGDFSLTFTRDTIDQPLVGEIGNYHTAGSLSIDGSFTATELTHTALQPILENLLPTTQHSPTTTILTVSGQAGPKSLGFYFASTQITDFGITIGDADTISNASIDWTVLDPYNVDTVIPVHPSGVWVKD